MRKFKSLEELLESDEELVSGVEVENSHSEEQNENDGKNGNDDLAAIRAALTTDLQPLGEALAGALQAGDLPAMQAALRKISEKMPELAGDAEALTAVLAEEFTQAFTQDTDEA